MSLDLLKTRAKKILKISTQKDIYTTYSKEKQQSAALGVYGDTEKTDMSNWIKDKVDLSNSRETQVDGCATEEDLKNLWKTWFNKPAEVSFDQDGNPLSESEDSFYYALGAID